MYIYLKQIHISVTLLSRVKISTIWSVMHKVLVIEDEQLVARMWQKTLEASGFEVETVFDGESGIEKMKSWKPDLVLMDVMMPKMNGIQALDEISNHDDIKHIPVVMLTNLSGKHDAELAKSKGAVEYWVKRGADPESFSDKIKTLIKENSK